MMLPRARVFALQRSAAGLWRGGVRRMGSSVAQRLAVLHELQGEADARTVRYELELQALRRKLHEDMATTRERRAAIVSGGELTEDEKALEPFDEDDQAGVPSEVLDQEGDAIERFWLTVLRRALEGRSYTGAAELSMWLTERDAEALAHLTDLQVSFPSVKAEDGSHVMRLCFKFRPNPFFENEKLEIDFDRSGTGALLRTAGCQILWKPEMDVTVRPKQEAPPPPPRGKKGKGKPPPPPKPKMVPTCSFFRIFGEASFEDSVEDLDRYDDDDVEVDADEYDDTDDYGSEFNVMERKEATVGIVEAIEQDVVHDACAIFLNADQEGVGDPLGEDEDEYDDSSYRGVDPAHYSDIDDDDDYDDEPRGKPRKGGGKKGRR